MSIGTFTSASFELLTAKRPRYDAALALACSAVDATALKLYGEKIKNNERYKKFLREKMPIITTFGFPGISAGAIKIKCHSISSLKTDPEGYVGIEEILYHILRCGLLHECDIDRKILFASITIIGDFSENAFRLPYFVIFGLLLAVVLDKRNEDERVASEIKLHINGLQYDLEELWGKENRFTYGETRIKPIVLQITDCFSND